MPTSHRGTGQLGATQAQLDPSGTSIERVADQLDQMVDRLDQAAANHRRAERLRADGDGAAADAMIGQAQLELEHLSQIRPDYDSVDVAVLRAAGIQPSTTDLLDPALEPAGSDTPPPTSTDDTDLLDPVDGTPESSPTPSPSDNDADLLDPTTDPDAPAIDETETLNPFEGDTEDPAPPPIDETDSMNPFEEPAALVDPVIEDVQVTFDEPAVEDPMAAELTTDELLADGIV